MWISADTYQWWITVSREIHDIWVTECDGFDDFLYNRYFS